VKIDMVINIGALLDQDYKYVMNDIRQVVIAAKGKTVKVILETCFLNQEQIVDGCVLTVLAGAHFVKTSTGFATAGAKLEDVRLMKLVVGDKVLVKAAGGVRSYSDAIQMLKYVARIGTSSWIDIVTGQTTTTNY